jgi:hypothetical protein
MPQIYMPEWQTRCGKRECRSDDRDPPLRRDPCHGCVRLRYQTMGITGRGNRERQLATRPGRSLASRRHQSRLTKTPMIRPGEVHQIAACSLNTYARTPGR